MVEPHDRVRQLYHLARTLVFCRSREEALERAVETLAHVLQARNAILWTFSAEKGSLVPAVTFLEDKGIKARSVSRSADFLGQSYKSSKPIIQNGEALLQSKHLQFSNHVVPETVLCYPFRDRKDLEGILELVNRNGEEREFQPEHIEFVREAWELVSSAALNWKSREDQSYQQLHAITRLTLLYDISQIFHSTLEMAELLPIITEKIRDILGAETCTIWVPDDVREKIRCSYSSGGYGEMFTAYTAALADDPAGEAIQTGEGILLEDASEEERLARRVQDPEETPIITYMNAPLVYKESVIGVLEVMNRIEGEAFFNEEDHFLLNDLAQQAAVSIYNANLLNTERKAKELDALLKVSQEITSTLDLNSVLLAAVNQAAHLVAFDRASIALLERGGVEVRAVSGRGEVDRKSPEIRHLEGILEWTAGLNAGLYVSELDGAIVADREETRQKFKAHFEETGYKSFVAIPLKDEEGQLGILCFESHQPYFLDERHLEVIGILANQVTVAVRNAQLYRQVPLIDLVQPLMKRKAALMKMPQSRRVAWAVGIAVGALLLAIIPWGMTVMGDVTVLPWLRAAVVSEVEGIIRNVDVKEGDLVEENQVVASLVDQDYELALERFQTRADLLLKEIRRSENEGDSAAARIHRIELSQVEREVEFARSQVARTRLLSPVSGLVTTPRIEEKAGQLIHRGEEFCEIANMKAVRAEVALDETDAPYLKNGQRVVLKLNSYPTLKFTGTVKILGAEVTSHNGRQQYVVLAVVEDPQNLLKPGMVGKARVEVGSHSVGYVLLRKPVGFLWKKLWVWLP